MRYSWLVAAVIVCTSCTDRKLPTAPTAVATPALPLPTPPLPTTVPGVLSLAMPIDPGDSANTAYGIAPYGYHGADHASDGHPGWDIEYRIGGIVRAAAAGTVQSVFPDPFTPGRFTVQIEHLVGTHHYRTVYTNLTSLSSDVVTAAPVRAGQALGTAGTIVGTIGTTSVSYAMTHFQLDDFEYYREIPNPNAVSPEPFLASSARTFFDALWSRAAFTHELVEPFATNPRDLRFPASRTWTRVGGDGPAGIRFTRRTAAAADYDYAVLAESGTTIESGSVVLGASSRPFTTIGLVSAVGTRAGLYDIVSNEMRLSLANPGAARPADLGGASTYRTVQ